MDIDGKCGVYRITNIVSKTVYVGRTVNLRHRWRQHKNRLKYGTHCNPHLQLSWNKYGEAAFVFAVEQKCESDVESAECEVALIAKLRAENVALYNVTTGGEGARHTPESRAKISRSRMGIVHSREVIERIAAQNRGRLLTDEHKARLKAMSYWKGKHRVITPEHRASISKTLAGRPGRPHSEEAKEKIRRAKTGFKHTQETKDKISETKRLKRLAKLDAKG